MTPVYTVDITIVPEVLCSSGLLEDLADVLGPGTYLTADPEEPMLTVTVVGCSDVEAVAKVCNIVTEAGFKYAKVCVYPTPEVDYDLDDMEDLYVMDIEDDVSAL